MLNTDRGADNYMIKYCHGDHQPSLIDVAPTRSAQIGIPQMNEIRRSEGSPSPHLAPSPPPPPSQLQPQPHPPPSISFLSPPRISRTGSGSGIGGPQQQQQAYTRQPHIHIAAIDNSLSFPHEHPHGWRAYTYGWLYLPVSLIGRPFSERTRAHFLPLLTSRAWWEETTFQLRKLFAVDPDFHPKMFDVSVGD